MKRIAEPNKIAITNCVFVAATFHDRVRGSRLQQNSRAAAADAELRMVLPDFGRTKSGCTVRATDSGPAVPQFDGRVRVSLNYGMEQRS